MIIGTLVMDLLWLAGLVGLSWLSITTAAAVHHAMPGALGLALGIVAGLFAWLYAAALLGAIAPKARPGSTRVMQGRDFYAWVIQFLIRRWLNMPLITPLWSQNIWFRWTTMRLLGAKMSIHAQLSSDVIVLDPHLLTLGRGTIIGAATGISGHMMIGDKLTFARITIGERVMIASDVGVMPGVTIADGAFIEPRVTLLPFSTIGEKARIGLGATIGARASVGAGARIARGAVVPDGAVIAPNAEFPSRDNAETAAIPRSL